MIPNHIAPTLSQLDIEMISHVRPGGNWKDIPSSVPSRRLEQIRMSFQEGKGSRSTYYGRLLPDDPSYTISTYFTRPGNGCNIHYGQDRTISFREAARLQSFPDDFAFVGSRTAIANQIGNAVPPLLGYQIARAIPGDVGAFVDLFSGAGGLALGFVWAGWASIVANDMDSSALETHKLNFDSPAVLGDITNDEIREEIVSRVQVFRSENSNVPVYILGGPPCQGFSTANGARSTTDMRNWLFREYASIVEEIRPDGIVFENVPGILNFERGDFFEMIKREFSRSLEKIRVERINSANFGVPQRRNRVILFGGRQSSVESMRLVPSTVAPPIVNRELRGWGVNGVGGRSAITAEEALGDLPPLVSGEDGTHLDYTGPPTSRYQALMRGLISPDDFLLRPRQLPERLPNPIVESSQQHTLFDL